MEPAAERGTRVVGRRGHGPTQPQPDVCLTASDRTRLDSPVPSPREQPAVPPTPLRRVKLTVVGDGTVGKTCLLYAFVNRRSPTDEYMPTVFENTTVDTEVGGQAVQLSLWDTAGQEEYCRLRRLIYPASDIFVLCYAVNNISSFENIATKWWPELRSFCPTTPVVLVATKTDLRPGPGAGAGPGPGPGPGPGTELLPESAAVSSRQGQQSAAVSSRQGQQSAAVSSRQGRRLARRLRAAGFLECSARACRGVQDVFEAAVLAVLAADRRRRRWQGVPRCCRLQ